MTDLKQNIINAFKKQRPKTAVPIWELEFHMWNSFSNKKAVFGTEFLNLTKSEKEHALSVNAEILHTVSLDLNFSAVTVPGSYWELAPGAPAYFWLPEDYRFKQIELLYNLCQNDFMLIAGSGGVLAMPDADNYIDFSLSLLESPEKIDKLAAQTYINGIEAAKKLIDVGVEAVYTASDIANNRGLYFNPEQLNRFILPYLKKWAEHVKSLGAFSILHTDGNITSCLKQITQTGINALQAIDPTAGMDMTKAMELTEGKICLCGNLDCGLLLDGSPKDVFESTKNLLDTLKNKKSFVLGASNAVEKTAPKENYLALLDAWKKHGSN